MDALACLRAAVLVFCCSRIVLTCVLTRLIHHGCTAPVTTAWAIAFETGASPFVIYQSIEILAFIGLSTEEAWPKSRVGFWIRNYETRWLLLDIISGCARDAMSI